jgi:hypothetical protein
MLPLWNIEEGFIKEGTKFRTNFRTKPAKGAKKMRFLRKLSYFA